MLFRLLVNTVYVQSPAQRHADLNRIVFDRDGARGRPLRGHEFFYMTRNQLAATMPVGHTGAGQANHLLDRLQMLQRWMIVNRP